MITMVYNYGFNTASGKYCCNKTATKFIGRQTNSFNTASGKYCCNRRSL